MIGSRQPGPGRRASGFKAERTRFAAAVLVLSIAADAAAAEPVALNVRATVMPPARGALTVTLFRWSTDAERASLATALSAPAPAAPAPAAPTEAAGRGGRGGRASGRGAPPPSAAVRLSGVLKAAPTLGYIWGDGVTGYSIKYAWRPPDSVAGGRVVLMIDRRLGVHAPEWGLPFGAEPDAEYTLIEMRLDASGAGEAKTSLSTTVALDPGARVPVLDGYAAAPAQFRITR